MPRPNDQFVDVDGLRARYWERGSQGSVVLLLHGIACSVAEWERNIDALSTQHRVIALDLAGFGLSGKPQDFDYTVRGLATFVFRFMDALKLDRVHMAGNSLGGRVALECAAIDAKRVPSMLLVDPAGIDEKPTLLEFRLMTLPIIGELMAKPNPIAVRMLWRKAVFDARGIVTQALVDEKLKLAGLPGAGAAFLKTLRAFAHLGGFHRHLVEALHRALPSMHIPTLVIWGRGDRFVPAAHADVLKSKMPQVQVQIWDRCGHVPMIEHADRFNRDAMAFWASVDRNP